MPALHKLQQNFASAMLRHDEDGLAGAVAPGDIAPDLRLRIYRNNILSSMISALGELFPVVSRLVGDAFFKAMAREFVLTQPPASGRLGEYGDGFPAFLQNFAPARSLPYLADVASIERAWLKAYRAADATVVSADGIAAVAPEALPSLTFTLHPSATLLRSDYPAGQIWYANQPGAAEGTKIEATQRAEFLLVIRPADKVDVRILTQARYEFLAALNSNRTITAAFEAAVKIDPAFDLQSALVDFITGGVFTSFALADTP